jgi:hypothetical protein
MEADIHSSEIAFQPLDIFSQLNFFMIQSLDMFHTFGIQEHNLLAFSILHPHDEIRVETAEIEKPNAHLREIPKKINFISTKFIFIIFQILFEMCDEYLFTIIQPCRRYFIDLFATEPQRYSTET